MPFYKTLILSFVAASMGTTACASSSPKGSSPASSAAPQYKGYLKPGASIRYSHDLKSKLTAGETATFKLTLGEDYRTGQLRVTLTTDGDITLVQTAQTASFDLADGPDHVIQMSFTANSNGRHYINVEALAVEPSGQSRPRIFSIPVQVGSVVAQKSNQDMKTMPDGENIIEMEAQEEIK